MSVVGFDLGSQGCHVAIARHGGVEVITNEYSERRSPSLVAFGDKQRSMGQSAKNHQVMNYKNTIFGFRNLLGRKFSDPFVQREIKNMPFEVVVRGADDIGIKVRNNDGEHVFSPEQITAMMLTYLKKVAEKALGKPVADCVISVPSYFTDAQRRALLDSSAIAGLNCLRLLNSTTAAALAYGIYKQDLPAETEKPRNVAFVNMGYSSLEVALCSFQKGKLKVLSKAFDPELGGRNLDYALVGYFIEEFKKKYKLDVQGRPKQILRLMGEVEKVKKMMGTVTTPIPLNIECFADDKDVNSSIKREVFEELCSDMVDRIKNTLETAIAKSKLANKDLDTVEVIGGSCRVPFIKKAMMDVFKGDLSTTLNLDEAVSRGCALQCAMLSPTFKVRDFSVSDIQPYTIALKWQAALEGENGNMEIFKEGDPIYHSKMLTFYRKEPFSLEARYLHPNRLPGTTNGNVGTFTIKNVTPTAEGEASKVKVKARMNIHGVFYIKEATLVEKQKQPEMSAEAMETDSGVPLNVQLPEVDKMAAGGGGESNGEGSTSTAATNEEPPPPPPPQSETETPAEGEKMDEGTSESKTEKESAQQGGGGGENMEANGTEDVSGGNTSEESPPTERKEDNSAPAKPPEAKKPKKPTVKYIALPIDAVTASMTKKELDGAHEVEVNLNYQDQLEQEKADARNAVEEYVYGMRDKLYGLGEYITEVDKEAFSNLLSATEDWLYDEGEDQPKKVYVEKLAELKKLGDPVVQREMEFLTRPAAFNELGGAIVHFEKIVQMHTEGVELYNHIEQADMDKVKEQVKVKREWHDSQMQACQTTPKHSNPPVTCAQIKAEVANLKTTCEPIVTKPKPKVEPPKDDKANDSEEGKEAENPPPNGPAGEDKMEEDPKVPPPSEENPPNASDDMDLD